MIFFSQSHLQRLTYLDDLDIDDRKKLSFYHVVPNSIFKVKWWPEWAPLIHAAYYGDVKGIWNILIRKCLKPRLAEMITFRNRQKARACLSSTPFLRGQNCYFWSNSNFFCFLTHCADCMHWWQIKTLLTCWFSLYSHHVWAWQCVYMSEMFITLVFVAFNVQ